MKIVLYLCTCGGTLEERLDFERIARDVRRPPHQIIVRTMPLLCSEESRERIAAELAADPPDRVVIGACSPREHEATFKRALESGGINPYLLQMVNLREQIAWVTPDRQEGTEKALTWLRGAIARVPLQRPLTVGHIAASPAVLVLGAGPAGLKAALTLAEAGRSVVLVERSPVIGGLPVRFEELFPALECGPCLMEPILAEVLHGKHADKIELLTLADVTGMVGFFGNYRVTIRQRPRSVDLERCIGCGECAEVCPNTLPNAFEENLAPRKAIDLPFTGALPNVPTLERSACRRWHGEECDLCKFACPLGDDLIDYAAPEEVFERAVGAIVVATGAGLLDGDALSALGYGTSPEVYTTLELERLLASSGPTGGEVLTRAGTPPRSIALIHCVGSRDESCRSYCSEVCCRGSLKYHHLLQQKLPQVTIRHFFRDLVLPGKQAAKLCHGLDLDADFSHYRTLADLTVTAATSGGCVVSNRREVGDGFNADMVILSPALVPAAGSDTLATLLDLPRDRFGFFEEMHDRVDVASSKLRGIYLAGTCQAPMDIQRSTLQGVAAAGLILAGLPEGRELEVDPVCAEITAERCSGCRVCNAVCPYQAIAFDPASGKSTINAVLCRGCGTCAAACPSRAIRAEHFSDAEILAELEGLLK